MDFGLRDSVVGSAGLGSILFTGSRLLVSLRGRSVYCRGRPEREHSVNLATIDIVLIVAFMAISIAIGVRLGRKQDSLESFALGGRNLPWWALLGSIVATETSTATFLGVTGRVAYGDGDMRFLQLAIGLVIGRIAMSMILLPLYFRGQIFTAYEVLSQRFGRRAQRVASLLFIITRNLGDGLRLFLCAVALEFAVGIPLPICIGLIGAVTIVFTVCGGMKSVVWNDCIQFAPWVDGAKLVSKLNAMSGPGVRYLPLRFTPDSSKYADEDCSGVNIVITNRLTFEPIQTGLAIAQQLIQLHGDRWETESLNRLLGSERVRESILAGNGPRESARLWERELADFMMRRSAFLIYPQPRAMQPPAPIK